MPRTRSALAFPGGEGLLGERGVAVSDLGSREGRAFVHGAYWAAEADDRIEKGAPVVVERVDGLRLHVRKA